MIGRMQQEGVLAVGVPEGVVMEATAAGGLGVFGRLGTGDGEDGLEAVGEEVGELSKDFTSSSSSSSSRFNSSSKELEARGPLIVSTDFGVSIFFTFSKLMLFTRLRGTIESLSSKRSRFWLDAALVDDGGGTDLYTTTATKDCRISRGRRHSLSFCKSSHKSTLYFSFPASRIQRQNYPGLQ